MSFFVISPAQDHVALDAKQRTGTQVFSVQNKTGTARRVRAVVTVEDPEQLGWYRVPDPVRQVRLDETVQFTVDVTVPEAVEPGRYEFRLKVLAEDDPDDVYTESQRIPIDVGDREGEAAFPWLAVAVVPVLVVAGVIGFMLLRDRDTTPPDSGATPTDPPTPPVTPTDPPTPPVTPTDPPTPPVTPTDPPTDPATAPPEAGLEGSWALLGWIEAPGPVQLGFEPVDGVLEIDGDRAAAWQFGIEDLFADSGNAAAGCEGRIGLGGRLEPTRGPDQVDWTSNMQSLRVPIGLAFCGRAIDTQQGLVTSPFDVLQDGDLLEMRNEHGTFTWRRR